MFNSLIHGHSKNQYLLIASDKLCPSPTQFKGGWLYWNVEHQSHNWRKHTCGFAKRPRISILHDFAQFGVQLSSLSVYTYIYIYMYNICIQCASFSYCSWIVVVFRYLGYFHPCLVALLLLLQQFQFTAFTLDGGCFGIDILQDARNVLRSEFTGSKLD